MMMVMDFQDMNLVKESNMSRVLVIPDLHLPVCHSSALQFCVDIYNKHYCDTVVFIGDIIDHHAISRHDKNPNCPSAADEYINVSEQLRQWYDTFPDAYVTTGNHDNRPAEISAEKAGVPEMYFKDLDDVWETPGWEWVLYVDIDGVRYMHGILSSGKTPALNRTDDEHMPVVLGHCHSKSGIMWGASSRERWFGMDVGCLIDVDAYQFAYGKHLRKKPILSCGVVLDGIPYHEIFQPELYK